MTPHRHSRIRPVVASFVLAAATALAQQVNTVPAAPVAAAETPKPAHLALKIDMTKEVTVEKDGKAVTEYASAETSARGDILRFVITYTNKGEGDLTNANVVDPVPQGTVYVADSAEGADTVITFSADNGTTFATAPLKQTVQKPDGTTEAKEVPPEAYTHVKWTVKQALKPGAAGQVSFKVRVK